MKIGGQVAKTVSPASTSCGPGWYRLMEEIRRSPVDMVIYPIIYRVLAPSQVVNRTASINSRIPISPTNSSDFSPDT